LNLSPTQKAFYIASAELDIEKEDKKFEITLQALGVKTNG